MPDLQIPNFGTLLAPYIGQVPPEARPRFLALLERGAAQRYREWADQLPAHAPMLLACAGREDEIADRVEAVFALDPALEQDLQEPLPMARATYYAVFADIDPWDQLRIQANAERQGAQAWRNIAATHPDPTVVSELAVCSALEESSAEALDLLIATHAS